MSAVWDVSVMSPKPFSVSSVAIIFALFLCGVSQPVSQQHLMSVHWAVQKLYMKTTAVLEEFTAKWHR